MQITLSHMMYLSTGIIGLILLAKCVLVKKENILLSEQLTQATISLESNRKKLSDLQRRHEEITAFQKSIREAELTTSLQKPRLYAAHDESRYSNNKNVPEKYSYIRSLTEKGMSVKEIATVLSISPHEANQLVTLTMISPAS
ncbi:hypothetical protein [Desulforhopalus sp. 52FAK]